MISLSMLKACITDYKQSTGRLNKWVPKQPVYLYRQQVAAKHYRSDQLTAKNPSFERAALPFGLFKAIFRLL